MIRILLVDDHAIARIGLATLLNGEPDMTIVGEAENGQEAVSLSEKCKPDVVVMDLVMPDISGAEATKRILSRPNVKPLPRILILTTFGTSPDLAQAVRNGATGVMMKDMSTRELIEGIRRIYRGEHLIPQNVTDELNGTTQKPQLSQRQLEILEALTKGLTGEDIARLLNITHICVRKHLQNIYNKIGAANRAEAVAIALKENLIRD